MEKFTDKTVVITGGATGIGFALARQFGADGANIVIAEPREVRLKEAVEKLEGEGITARYFVCDVTRPEQVEALADFAWGAFGAVHVLVNNAGISMRQRPMTEVRLDKLRALFDVNFFGVWHGAATFGRRFIEQGVPAAIYNLGSENAFFSAVPNSAAYVASKHAVHGLSVALREEMPDFITVGMICPGWVATELVDKRLHPLAMDADRFAAIVMQQVRAGEFYIVSHAYNMEHITARYEEVSKAYATYAPRYAGDEEYDVRTRMPDIIAALKAG